MGRSCCGTKSLKSTDAATVQMHVFRTARKCDWSMQTFRVKILLNIPCYRLYGEEHQHDQRGCSFFLLIYLTLLPTERSEKSDIIF